MTDEYSKKKQNPAQNTAPSGEGTAYTTSGINSYIAPSNEVEAQKSRLLSELIGKNTSSVLQPSANPYGSLPKNPSNPYNADNVFGKISTMNNESLGAYERKVRAGADAAKTRLEAQKYNINRNYDANVKAAGKATDAAISKLPENMAGLGLYGQGVGETAIANIRNDYTAKMTELMKQRDADIYNIDSQIEGLRQQAEADIYNYNAQLMAQNPSLYLQTLQMEQDNYYKNAYLGIDESKVTGVYNGQDTMAKKAQDAELTGEYNGKRTLDATQVYGVDDEGNKTADMIKHGDSMTFDWASLRQADAHKQAELILEWARKYQEDAHFVASSNDKDQADAEASIWNLVAMGQPPSDELLGAAGLMSEKAGITAAAALAAQQAAYGMSGGSGGGRSSGGRSSGGKSYSGGSGGSSTGVKTTATSARRIAGLVNEMLPGDRKIVETTTGNFDLGNVEPWEVAGYVSTLGGLTDAERYAYISDIVGGDEAADEAIEYASRTRSGFKARYEE